MTVKFLATLIAYVLMGLLWAKAFKQWSNYGDAVGPPLILLWPILLPFLLIDAACNWIYRRL